jgi:hypothetical protein
METWHKLCGYVAPAKYKLEVSLLILARCDGAPKVSGIARFSIVLRYRVEGKVCASRISGTTSHVLSQDLPPRLQCLRSIEAVRLGHHMLYVTSSSIPIYRGYLQH